MDIATTTQALGDGSLGGLLKELRAEIILMLTTIAMAFVSELLRRGKARLRVVLADTQGALTATVLGTEAALDKVKTTAGEKVYYETKAVLRSHVEGAGEESAQIVADIVRTEIHGGEVSKPHTQTGLRKVE